MSKLFEEFLIDKHADQYVGIDDDMPDDFNSWLEDLSIDEWIEYADKYAKQKLERSLEACEASLDIMKAEKEAWDGCCDLYDTAIELCEEVLQES